MTTPFLRSALLLLSSGLLLGAPAAAQDAPPIQAGVEGRNSWLKNRLTVVTSKARAHVVQIPGRGYAVVVKKGYALTSARVLPKSDGALEVVDAKGRRHETVVQGRDAANGIALLRFTRPGPSPAPIAFGSSSSLRIGQFVVVAGTSKRPLGVGVVGATKRAVDKGVNGSGGNVLMQLFGDGTNQGHRRAFPSVIHHDSLLEPEHFGSPLLDTAGRLVGVNVAYPFRGSAHAVDLDRIKPILEVLYKGGAVKAPTTTPAPATGDSAWLGARVEPATPEQLGVGHAFGLRVTGVTGPAKASGLKIGDVVVELNDKAFGSIDSFAARLRDMDPGDKITLTVLRGKAGVELEISVTLGKR